jgi:type IV pilus assembly protein PilC
MLATLLRSGIELVRAIETAAAVSGSPRYANAFAAVADALRNGESLATPLERAKLFDPLVIALVRVGEESGTLDEMLLKLADYYESDVEAAIATIGTLIEPALIVVLGAVVGCIVFSIFLPLYSLTAEVTAP